MNHNNNFMISINTMINKHVYVIEDEHSTYQFIAV